VINCRKKTANLRLSAAAWGINLERAWQQDFV
jgi:hypothetical protein